MGTAKGQSRNDTGCSQGAITIREPCALVSRVPTEDIELEGKVLQKGSRVQLGIGAANHDLTEFSNPEQLDFTPPKVNSLAFGYGPHFCLGAALARMEAQIALSEIVASDAPGATGDKEV